MKEVARNIYQITLPTPFLVGPINTYLIKSDVLTLVDTGPNTEEAYTSLKQGLKKHNIELQDIEIVLLTHHHPDHIGLLEKFIPTAKIYAHKKVIPWLKKEEIFLNRMSKFYQTLYKTNGVPKGIIELIEQKTKKYLDFYSDGYVDNVLEDGKNMDGLPEWSIFETPGHAQSHVSFYRKSDGVMIAGDHLIEHISSNAIIEGPYGDESERPKTLLQYRNSLKKCRFVDIAFSGHGKTVYNPKQLIDLRLYEQVKKAQMFKSLIGHEPMTCFDICRKKYDHVFKRQPDLTFSETLGHLDLLEDNNEIKKIIIDDVIHYQLISH
ncbi:MBL fold metallo-hydrolase [Evansella sp. AB-rgal1]|uniref:MBL fold metallo-hydrolase n=1 Tax=Evansella sp. AB-rgal1 TaxID=3242696 RepID=UPI00359CD882